MCGICAIYNFDRNDWVHPDELDAMNRTMIHRGPDDSGRYIEKNVGLAMRRLSIVDVQAGHQPLSNEDGSIQIVFNGEIYNHSKLRPELERRGHHYRTRSDTETIVHMYEEYGEHCVDFLRGMFAFAIWDGNQKRFFCARDRLGIKPLYYCLVAGRSLIVGSEIKALLQFQGMRAELARDAVSEYLALGYLSGSRTLFSGIRSLEPGHTLSVREHGDIQFRRYWDLPFTISNEPRRSHQEHAVHYRELLDQAVNNHQMSDVPLGVLLSGGLDSSIVAALTKKTHRGSVQTFSVGYGEAESSELPMAQRVAEFLKTEHHQVKVTADDFFRALPRLIWHEDQPLIWPSSVPLYFVCQLAQEHVKVVLTGEGSDESMAGYDRYAFTLWNRQFANVYGSVIPRSVRRRIAKSLRNATWIRAQHRRRIGHSFLARDNSLESLFLDNFQAAFARVDQAEILAAGVGGDPYEAVRVLWRDGGDFLTDLLCFDIRTYLIGLLRKQDRMSMAASIESRVPFLDHVVVEYALGIPASHKIRGLDGKRVLKEAANGVLPDFVIHQKKRGFPTPWRTWLFRRLEEVESLLLDPRSKERNLFQPDALIRIFSQHRNHTVDHSDRIWRLLNLELWHRVFVDGDPAYQQQPQSWQGPQAIAS